MFFFIFQNFLLNLDLGPPVNAPAHYRSPIFMYNVALRSTSGFATTHVVVSVRHPITY